MAPEMTSIPSGVEPTGVVDMFCMGILILYVSVDMPVLLTFSAGVASSFVCWLTSVVDLFLVGILFFFCVDLPVLFLCVWC